MGDYSLATLLAEYMLKNRYNYSFLRASHDKVKMCEINTIVTGSSHALHGITESAFSGGCANLSMHSQDIYYDMVNAKYALQNSKCGIQNCIIIMGYYIIAQDLSKSKRLGHDLIRKVYYPLFQDARHWEDPECIDIWENFEADLKDPVAVKKETEAILDSILWEGYYNNYRQRRVTIFDWNGKIWEDLSKEERQHYGKLRAEAHNKLFLRKETIIENQNLFAYFLEYLRSENVRPIVVITPHTKEYMKYINAEYKKLIVGVIEETIHKGGNPVEFYDMNEEYMWEASDFMDTDHLSLEGANKVSTLLNEKFCI